MGNEASLLQETGVAFEDADMIVVENDPRQAAGASRLINPATDPLSELATEAARCPLCKRFPHRFEYEDPRGGKISVCTRCTHHMDANGFDDDFRWALDNITEDDGLNLRWERLSDVRASKSAPE